MDLDQLWKNTQEELKIILAPAVYQTFVVPTQLISFQDSSATIACSSSYLVDMNHKRYYHLFKSALDNQAKTNSSLNFINQPPVVINTKPIGPLFSSSTEQKAGLPMESKAGSPAEAQRAKAGLHPRYTFDNLIVGNSNNFAYAAAQGIVKNPGLSYNPFFIWGGVGVGKTHLMQAIGHELLRFSPQTRLKYFPAETFANELINALKSKSMTQFKDKYRNLDCILVDDIQFIAGKEYIQEEFFHTFNALHLTGKQVILTSDRKPADIDRLEDRLVSRFMGGLTVDIQLPDYEMRLAIIKQNADNRNIVISSEGLNFLADNLSSNIRDIQGRLQEIAVQSKSQGMGDISLDTIQRLFSSTPVLPSSQLNPRHLISVCAKHFQIKTSDLCGSSRRKELVYARHITAYLLLTKINLPLQEVGRILGGRDHTSIMHARDKIHTSFSTNPQTRQLINLIVNQL